MRRSVKSPHIIAVTILGAGLAVSGCSQALAGGPQSASDAPEKSEDSSRVSYNKNPFPSTYQRYGGRPTAIKNVIIFDGEGGRIDNGVVTFADGIVVAIGGADTPVPEGATIIDGAGKYVTPGIIDIHSHLGNYPSPSVDAVADGNEVTGPVTADVWAEHGVWPQDPGFSRAMVNGGITSLQILPGSANLFGGRSVTLKNVPARTVQGMKFPDAPQGLKMACGENPKRVYGSRRQKPGSRMGNLALNRQTWARAVEYKRRWDNYEKKGGTPPTRNIGMDTLKLALEGEIKIHNHCYRADEMVQVIDMAKEFGYTVSTFHHAVESYKIADILKDNGICSALWADWWGFKLEAYDGIPENVPLVEAAGACAIVHSDDQDQIQRLNQEAGKALADGRRMGLEISDATAISWITYNPAKAMGIEKRTGSLKADKMADIVLWNGNPLSVYSRPEKVWIDGAMLYDAYDPKRRPVSDFELGQPGEGDTK